MSHAYLGVKGVFRVAISEIRWDTLQMCSTGPREVDVVRRIVNH